MRAFSIMVKVYLLAVPFLLGPGFAQQLAHYDLPGNWRFKIDPHDVGVAEEWFALTHSDSQWDTLLILPFAGRAQESRPFLSHLSATRDSPLYTTYAAAMERSEFTLDEGYHFLFYDSSRGLDFTTDTGGDLCLAFKKGAEYVYRSADLFEAPRITASYPDMVKYHYRPFEQVLVEATFLVQSSHHAVHEVMVKNIGSQTLEFQIIPFLQNNYRTFADVIYHQDKHAITFTHQELPDGWVLGHDVPYVDKLRDVFLLSRQPDRLTGYRSYKWGDIEIPLEVHLERDPLYVVWGEMTHPDGSRCRHQTPRPDLRVILNNDSSRILTETAPVWGSSEPNINPRGYYRVELGNFENLKEGDTYTLIVSCRETGQSAVVTGRVTNPADTNRVRRDVQLELTNLAPAPLEIDKDVWGSGAEIRLFWRDPAPNLSYMVYRRDYRKGGIYQRISEKTKNRFYTDKDIQGDQIYGYVVLAVDEQGNMSAHSREINNIAGSDFLTDMRYPDQLRNDVTDFARVLAMPFGVKLTPGASEHFRIIRAVSRPDTAPEKLMEASQRLLTEDLKPYLRNNERLFQNLQTPKFEHQDHEMLYWSAFNLMRQVMLPPEGKCSYNYYVFSREPTWGWGHGGQVFHESLTMLAYAYLDPQSAMNSQRVYSERQHEDGYINYRSGPYLDETIPHNDQLTTSAPLYAWQNWELYRITRDKPFLREMYESGKAFYNYYVANRNRDGDGLCEWGAHAVLESVRDARVAVWDQVGWPSNFEALDLNSMLVQEAKALAAMAKELGFLEEAQQWNNEAAQRQEKINRLMWDDETGFYYHVDKTDHDFSFKAENDLRREEIIGFLPLWAGIADSACASRLVEKLTDPEKFWRKFGAPSLAADDPYYNPKGYWNGPVWVEWDFLIVHGLLQYGYDEAAKELVGRVAANMIAQLKKDHQFWEFYSPDDQWAGYHRQYIWAGLIARMLLDVYGVD